LSTVPAFVKREDIEIRSTYAMIGGVIHLSGKTLILSGQISTEG